MEWMVKTNLCPAPAQQSEEQSVPGQFCNEVVSGLHRRPEVRRAMRRRWTGGGQLGREYDLIIGGQRLKTEGKIGR